MAEAASRHGFVREGVRDILPVVHGSVSADELARYGVAPADLLDFSVNTNPLGPAPSVLSAIGAARWDRYPGDDEAPLLERLAAACGVSSGQVAIGNGSSELLWLLALAVLEPRDHVAVLGPTFGEYARAARVLGATVLEAREPSGLPADARMAFVCNPNNPTGAYLGEADLARLLEDAPERLLVLDESYASFAPDRWQSEPLLDRYQNLVVLRSMTKDQALPGLRLGYLLAEPSLTAAVEAVRPPWSVNAGALRAGLAALEAKARDHLDRARAIVAESRAVLVKGFERLGFAAYPSYANFVLIDVGDGEDFRRRLLPAGLVVRDCASFGLPACVRVACLLPDQCRRLLEEAGGSR